MPVASSQKSDSLPQPDTTTEYMFKPLTFLRGHHYLAVREFLLVLYERWVFERLAELIQSGKSGESVDVKERVMDHSGFLKIVETRVRTAIRNSNALGKCEAVTISVFPFY